MTQSNPRPTMTAAQRAGYRHCEVTGNRCGTDTWGAKPCHCVPCQLWLAERAGYRHLRELADKWDRQGAGKEPPWSTDSMHVYREVAAELRAALDAAPAQRLQHVAPQIVPTERGGEQWEWHQDGLDVEIEFKDGHIISAFAEVAPAQPDVVISYAAPAAPEEQKMKPLPVVDDRPDHGDDGTELALNDPEAAKLLAMADVVVSKLASPASPGELGETLTLGDWIEAQRQEIQRLTAERDEARAELHAERSRKGIDSHGSPNPPPPATDVGGCVKKGI